MVHTYGALRRTGAVGLALLATLGLSTLGLTVAAVAGPVDPMGMVGTASAAGANLRCVGGTVYSLDTTDHILYSVDADQGTQTEVSAFGATGASISSSVALNGLALTRNGTAAYAVTQSPGKGGTPTVYRFDPVTGNTVGYAGPSMAQTTVAPSIVMGGIDPANGIYYFATVTSSTATIEFYGFDTTTNTAIPGRIGTLTGYPGANGDLVFDSLGHLYLVATSGNGTPSANPLVSVDGVMPSIGGNTVLSAKTIAKLEPDDYTFNGIAFDSTGNLFVEARASSPTRDVIYELNPNSGAVIGSNGLVHGSTTSTQSGDLASCTYNNSLSLTKNIVDRAAPTDQFALAITGAGLTSGNTGTTTGDSTGAQTAPTAIAGPVVGVSGSRYTLTETPAAGADAGDYLSSYRCVDQSAGNAVIASGNATSFTLDFPQAPTPAGRNVVCTFTNGALQTTKTLTAVNGRVAGDTTSVTDADVLTYAVTVTNPMPAGSPSGTTTLTEAVPANTAYTGSGEGWTCAATTPGSICTQTITVAPGASVVAPFTVTVGDLPSDVTTLNNVVGSSSGSCTSCVVSTPVTPSGPSAPTATPTATVTATPTAPATSTAASSPTPTSTATPVPSTPDATPTPSVTSTAVAVPVDPKTPLASTGSDLRAGLLLAAGFCVLGAGLVVLARRRRA